MAYEKLTRFAGKLADNPGHWSPITGSGTETDPFIFPWFELSDTLDAFVDAFYELEDIIADFNYLDTLERRGIEASKPGFDAVDIDHADLELIRALITTSVRQDRFVSGLLGGLANRGFLDRCLLRLKELDEGAESV